jgi:ABC-type Na+ efflux pump permease subunit
MKPAASSSHLSCRRTRSQLLAIARATLMESIQQPIAFLLLYSAILTTLLVPVFQFHRFGEDGRLARDSGLSMMLLVGLVLAAGTAGYAVAQEIARGTAAAILGKPVSRLTFILAKWLGCCGVLALFWSGLLAATLLAERGSSHAVLTEEAVGHLADSQTILLAVAAATLATLWAAVRHYLWRRRFGVTAFLGIIASQWLVVGLVGFFTRSGTLLIAQGTRWYDPELNLRLLPAAVLCLAALTIFAALATALATRLQTGAVLAIAFLVLLLGLTGDTFATHAAPLSLRGLVAGLMPDIQHFWMCDALANNGRIAWSYVFAAIAYAATSCTLFLTAGFLAFKERDLG